MEGREGEGFSNHTSVTGMDGGHVVEKMVPPQFGAKMKALCPDTHDQSCGQDGLPPKRPGSSVLLDHEAHQREDF